MLGVPVDLLPEPYKPSEQPEKPREPEHCTTFIPESREMQPNDIQLTLAEFCGAGRYGRVCYVDSGSIAALIPADFNGYRGSGTRVLLKNSSCSIEVRESVEEIEQKRAEVRMKNQPNS